MPKKPITVLYVNHTAVVGGAGNSLRYLLENLPPGLIEPVVLCPEGSAAVAFRKSGFTVYPISPLPTFGSSVGTPSRGFRLLKLANPTLYNCSKNELLGALDKIRPDLVHLNERYLIHAAATCKRLGLPVVMHARNVADRDTRWIHNLTTRFINKYTDRMVAIDESVRYSLREVERFEVIYNPLSSRAMDELQYFDPNQRRRMADGKVRFLFLSVLRDFKGIWDLLNAAILLRDRNDFEILVSGGNSRAKEFYDRPISKIAGWMGFAPDEEKAVREFVERNKLTNVRLLGHVNDVETLFESVDVNVFPSWLNGPSRGVFETGIREIPTIIALKDRVEDVIRHRHNGWIVKERDPVELARAMAELGDKLELRKNLGAAARKQYLEQFEPRRAAEQIVRLYREVLDEHAGINRGSKAPRRD